MKYLLLLVVLLSLALSFVTDSHAMAPGKVCGPNGCRLVAPEAAQAEPAAACRAPVVAKIKAESRELCVKTAKVVGRTGAAIVHVVKRGCARHERRTRCCR